MTEPQIETQEQLLDAVERLQTRVDVNERIAAAKELGNVKNYKLVDIAVAFEALTFAIANEKSQEVRKYAIMAINNAAEQKHVRIPESVTTALEIIVGNALDPVRSYALKALRTCMGNSMSQDDRGIGRITLTRAYNAHRAGLLEPGTAKPKLARV